MNFKPHVFWLFGLSGADKFTLAALLAADSRPCGVPVLSLAGDVLRAGLCRGLGFSEADRAENLRRSAEAARIEFDSDLCVIAAFITLLETHRQLVENLIGPDRLSLLWVYASLATCRARDVKGLYARATVGNEPQMTGLGSRFDPPTRPSLTLVTTEVSDGSSNAFLCDIAFKRL